MFIKKYAYLFTLGLSLTTPLALYSAMATNDAAFKAFNDYYNLLDQATNDKNPLQQNFIKKLRQQDLDAIIAAIGQNKQTLVHLATNRNNLKIATWLLSNGAYVDAKDSSKDTPLHVAARLERLEIAKLLIDYGANIDTQDTCGWTPLHATSITSSPAIMELLILKGANKLLKTHKGDTPLNLMIQNNQFQGFIALLGTADYTPANCVDLFLQPKLGNTRTLQTLKKTGDINTQNNAGNTALHLAILKNAPHFIELLCNHPLTRLDIKNKDGKTALDLATDTANDACVKLLTAAAISKTSKPRI